MGEVFTNPNTSKSKDNKNDILNEKPANNTPGKQVNGRLKIPSMMKENQGDDQAEDGKMTWQGRREPPGTGKQQAEEGIIGGLQYWEQLQTLLYWNWCTDTCSCKRLLSFIACLMP